MEEKVKNNLIFQSKYSETASKILTTSSSATSTGNLKYINTVTNTSNVANFQVNSAIERMAQWFLNKTSMSNKKLQKLCYYAYCWYIVFNNDIETITEENKGNIKAFCSESFQAWIHGPVCPQLYQRYKKYGWREIPRSSYKPQIDDELESLFQQVWDAYGSFSGDELEAISHSETPWRNARKGIAGGEACTNIISTYDILQYYSQLI